MFNCTEICIHSTTMVRLGRCSGGWQVKDWMDWDMRSTTWGSHKGNARGLHGRSTGKQIIWRAKIIKDWIKKITERWWYSGGRSQWSHPPGAIRGSGDAEAKVSFILVWFWLRRVSAQWEDRLFGVYFLQRLRKDPHFSFILQTL